MHVILVDLNTNFFHTYRHECAEIYIYKYNGRVIRWLIGPEAGSIRAYALSHDTGNIDDNTRWHLWFPEENIWRVDDGATYGCGKFTFMVIFFQIEMLL